MIQYHMNEIRFKDLTIEHISKRTLKNSYITLKPVFTNDTAEMKIILKTPKVSQSYIINLLNDKEAWIRKKLHHFSNNKPKILNLEDEVLLFGELLSIDDPQVSALSKSIKKVAAGDEKRILQCYEIFYKNYAKEYLLKRLYFHAQIMGLEYQQVKFRKMKSRWGSCSANRVITLNTQLIKIKKELIDYVLVHELAHLVHMNHSKEFHALVQSYLPEAKSLRKELHNTHLWI